MHQLAAACALLQEAGIDASDVDHPPPGTLLEHPRNAIR
jgi:hypothetical protein